MLSRQAPAADAGPDPALPDRALSQFRQSFDSKWGGFGAAPKFPAAHNLLFLMDRYRRSGDAGALQMAELTLRRMYEGGIFDHIGGGFCRYSTDREFMIPHFEKMLYDNALLIFAYSEAFELTGGKEYLSAARRTADWAVREMAAPDGGFYSSQDADSGGEEGLFYAFTPDEAITVLGPEGERLNRCLGITAKGNFRGLSIPYLAGSPEEELALGADLEKMLEYRKKRRALAVDDKILGSWNSLMIAALARLYRACGEKKYLGAALRCQDFLSSRLLDGDRLRAGISGGRKGGPGYLDDYAFAAFALLELSRASQRGEYLSLAESLCRRVLADFADREGGGFFMTGRDGEELIFRPKETWDGAMPSGNSVMAWVLVRLSHLAEGGEWDGEALRQLGYMCGQAGRAPMGYAFFLLALSEHADPPERITAAAEPGADPAEFARALPPQALVTVLPGGSKQYPLLNGRAAYYVCTGRTCLPPSAEPPPRR